MRVDELQVGGLRTKRFILNDLIVGVPTDIGPRILYVATRRRPESNLFGVLLEAGVATSEGFWRIYGGHRLWSSPEAKPRSYSIDSKPVKITAKDDTLTIYGNPEPENSIQKTMTIRPFSEDAVKVVHTIKNIGRWPIELACWALSVMTKKGFAIIPLSPSKVDEEGLLPDRHVTFWPYTNLSDRRLTFADGYIFVRQDPAAHGPVKVGAMANPSWVAYWVEGTAFVKEFLPKKGEYPDFGCSVEVYTNPDMLELETVGPLKKLGPGQSVEHVEVWRIFNIEDLAPEPESVKVKLEALLGR